MKILTILILAVLLSGCEPELIFQGPPLDWDYTIPVDEEPEPVVLDTCSAQDLHEVNDPAFISLYVAFDCEPNLVFWFVGDQYGFTEDLATMIQNLNPGVDTVEVYVGDSEIAVIIDGTNDKAWIEGRVSCLPDCYMVDHHPRVQRRSLFLGGALTFGEWMGVLDRHPSNAGINMRNGLTQSEKDLLWENNLDYDSCKIGPQTSPLDNVADFRFDFAPQGIKDRYLERKWNVWD